MQCFSVVFIWDSTAINIAHEVNVGLYQYFIRCVIPHNPNAFKSRYRDTAYLDPGTKLPPQSPSHMKTLLLKEITGERVVSAVLH